KPSYEAVDGNHDYTEKPSYEHSDGSHVYTDKPSYEHSDGSHVYTEKPSYEHSDGSHVYTDKPSYEPTDVSGSVDAPCSSNGDEGHSQVDDSSKDKYPSKYLRGSSYGSSEDHSESVAGSHEYAHVGSDATEAPESDYEHTDAPTTTVAPEDTAAPTYTPAPDATEEETTAPVEETTAPEEETTAPEE
ncbi:hypothetical protein F443_12465, partial [Phytophthora nicotianae P1569]